MKTAAVEAWAEGPMRSFVDDARVRLALLLHPSGQVIAQHGFARAVDVMSACALAAAIHASAGELGRQLEGRPFGGLHHAGRERQIFLAETPTPRGSYVLLTAFDRATSLGLVRVYYDEFRAALARAAAPDLPIDAPAEDFERQLNRSLATLFGRGRPGELPSS